MNTENEVVATAEEETQSMKKKALQADLALLLVAMLWGGGFIAGKVALNSFQPFTLLSIRFLGSAFIMGIVFHKKMKYIPKHTWFSGMVIGIFMFVGMAAQATGLKYTTASKQAFLVASYTVFVPFLSWLITKKKPSIYAFVAGAMTLCGIGVLSLTSDLTIQFGDALSLLFALIFGAQIVYIGIFVRNVDMVQFTVVQLITGGVLEGIAAVFLESPIKTVTVDSLMGLLYLLVPSTIIAFTVQNIAQKYTSDTHTSIILSLESVFGVLFAVLLLGEQFTLRMGIGAVIIFCAVLLSNFEKR